jgi:hypothetical protein
MIDKSAKFTQLVRVGYFARAILYIVLGLIALTSAARIREGTNGAMQAIENFPGGTFILWILVIGLTAYALFRFASTFFDIENHGSQGRGLAARVGHAGSGIAHLALAWSAFQFATSGTGGSSGSAGGAQDAASGVLSMSLGPVLLGLLGLALIVAAAFQAKEAYTGNFMRRVDRRAPDATRWIGRAGFAARAVVYLIIGWSLVQAAWLVSSSQVETLGGAVASLADDGVWFTLVAIGLLAFGLFSLILARYRIIPDLDVSGRVPAFRAG